jgi:hypothetical protein
MSTAPWRCYLRWPPGHTWAQAHLDERTFLRCDRCGKEKWPGDPHGGEKAIRTIGRGFGDPSDS